MNQERRSRQYDRRTQRHSPSDDEFHTPPTSPKQPVKASNADEDDWLPSTQESFQGLSIRKRPSSPGDNETTQAKKSSRKRRGPFNVSSETQYLESKAAPGPLKVANASESLATSIYPVSTRASVVTTPATSFNPVSSKGSIATSPATSFTSAALKSSAVTTPATSFGSEASILVNKEYLDLSRGPMPKDAGSSGEQKATATSLDHDVERTLQDGLRQHPPFGQKCPPKYANVPFRQIWEVTRFSNFSGLPLVHFGSILRGPIHEYETLWSSAVDVMRDRQCNKFPERSSGSSWDTAETDPIHLSLRISLNFVHSQGPLRLKASFHPLRKDRSHRFARRFGGDRFCVIDLPNAELRDPDKSRDTSKAAANNFYINWLIETTHDLAGRSWKVFFVEKDRKAPSGKSKKTSATRSVTSFYLFAMDGNGLVPCALSSGSTSTCPIREIVPISDLLHWHMDADLNQNTLALKLFSRLKLGLSRNAPTIEFKPEQVIRSGDVCPHAGGFEGLEIKQSERKKSPHSPIRCCSTVMNDGCARISIEAAEKLRQQFGLSYIPTAFQGRIMGAKGMWMVDLKQRKPGVSPGNLWIEIVDSQLKYTPHREDQVRPDPWRVTFEVNDFVTFPRTGSLSFQLIPILQNRGVPFEVFKELIRDDIEQKMESLEASLSNPVALLSWCQEHLPASEVQPDQNPSVFPTWPRDRIKWFLAAGFLPGSCSVFADEIRRVVAEFCSRFEDRKTIEIDQSVSVLMLPDPTGVLKEGEVHLSFSESLRDTSSGFGKRLLKDFDVLVSRSPAYLPSDIQRVRAVCVVDLIDCPDAIFFSTQGPESLATKLSGGDFDGDKAWVCWDQRLVQPFQNAQMQRAASFEQLGIRQESLQAHEFVNNGQLDSDYLSYCLNFNLSENMLGVCANYHERLCYVEKAVDSPEALEIGQLLGYLVDAPKNGYRFQDADWKIFTDQRNLKRNLPRPAYKTNSIDDRSRNIIDRLVLEAQKVKGRVLERLNEWRKKVPKVDSELSRRQANEDELARTNGALKKVMNHVRTENDRIYETWHVRTSVHTRKEDKEAFWPSDLSSNIDAEEDSDHFPETARICRAAYRNIEPSLGHLSENLQCQDRRILYWQDQYQANQPSEFDLLKASIAFQRYNKGKFVWYTAGPELRCIKASARGIDGHITVVGDFYNHVKVDSRLVRRQMASLQPERVEDAALLDHGEMYQDDVDDRKSDNDDDYIPSSWMDPGKTTIWEYVEPDDSFLLDEP